MCLLTQVLYVFDPLVLNGVGQTTEDVVAVFIRLMRTRRSCSLHLLNAFIPSALFKRPHVNRLLHAQPDFRAVAQQFA